MSRGYEADLKVCEAATPGPWLIMQGDEETPDRVISPDYSEFDEVAQELLRADSEFIAMAREALPWYVERCKELEKFRESVQKRFAFLADNSAVSDEMLDIKTLNKLVADLQSENQRLREALEIAKSYMPWEGGHPCMGSCTSCGKTTVSTGKGFCTECASEFMADVLKGEGMG